MVAVRVDSQGRMLPAALASALASASYPSIVVAQAGNVNTGAVEELGTSADLAAARGAWCHVDGAFGLWAQAAPLLRHLTDGAERANSWAVDAHKWLNVPYDCAAVIVADPDAHRASLVPTAAYLPLETDGLRSGWEWAPEFSRRARGFTVYAALRSLGRDGVRNLIEGSCRHAQRMATDLAAHPRVSILNDVVLNQILVRIDDDDAVTARVLELAQTAVDSGWAAPDGTARR